MSDRIRKSLRAAKLNRPWVDSDNAKLTDLWMHGVTIGRIARDMGRTHDYIRERLIELDLFANRIVPEAANFRIMRYDRNLDRETQVGWASTWDEARHEARRLNSLAPSSILYWSEPKSWDGYDINLDLCGDEDMSDVATDPTGCSCDNIDDD